MNNPLTLASGWETCRSNAEGMKVLVIMQPPTFGGPHNQVLRLNKELSELGWTTEVVLPTEPGNAAARLVDAGVTVFHVRMSRMRKSWHLEPHLRYLCDFMPTINELRDLIRSRNPDVVQVCGVMNLQAGMAATRERRPLVWQLLGTFAPPMLRQILTPIVKARADRIMTAGLATAKAHPGLGEEIGEKVSVFYPPVDTQEFRFSEELRRNYRGRFGIKSDELLIATVGNCNRAKGHDLFVAVANRMRGHARNVKFRIFGSCSEANREEYEKSVVSVAQLQGLYENGYFDIVEPGSNIPGVLSASDLFLLTSIAEGAPTAVIEAMACSIPVVCTEVGAVRELVEEGETGFICGQHDDKALCNALLLLIENKELRRRLSAASRDRVLKSFSVKECAKRHVDVYCAALKDREKR